MAWYSKEADKTYIAWGGLIIALFVVVGLMVLHNADKEKDLLSPGAYYGNDRDADGYLELCCWA